MLSKFVRIAEKEFSKIVSSTEFLFDAPHLIEPSRLRLYLIDDSFLDIRYDEESGDYSFHWQKANEITRFNNAPHHIAIKTFPRHIHLGSENNVVEDNITSPKFTPEDNFRKILKWIANKVQR